MLSVNLGHSPFMTIPQKMDFTVNKAAIQTRPRRVNFSNYRSALCYHFQLLLSTTPLSLPYNHQLVLLEAYLLLPTLLKILLSSLFLS